MTDQRTIADSKRAFHTAFPYVIPSLYRRTADELLVELHLLSHQQHFKSDALFAVGLRQVFTAFTQGYKPESHLDELYGAICTCNGFDPEALKQLAEGSTSAVSGHTVGEVREWLSNRGAGAPEPLASSISSVGGESFHYSRLMAVGLLSLLSSAQGGEPSDPVELKTLAHDIGEQLGLSKPRLEKDISLYTSNLEKMAQAVELIEETLAAERRKRDRQVADSQASDSKEAEAQSESTDDSAAEESTN